jgi:hypothetical protein
MLFKGRVFKKLRSDDSHDKRAYSQPKEIFQEKEKEHKPKAMLHPRQV